MMSKEFSRRKPEVPPAQTQSSWSMGTSYEMGFSPMANAVVMLAYDWSRRNVERR
jgi:hypothetical protein